MTDSIFTSLIAISMSEARSQFADSNNAALIAEIQNNPEAFTENISLGHAARLMSIFMDYTLQNYHNFLCVLLKEKGIDISNLEDFRYLLKE